MDSDTLCTPLLFGTAFNVSMPIEDWLVVGVCDSGSDIPFTVRKRLRLVTSWAIDPALVANTNPRLVYVVIAEMEAGVARILFCPRVESRLHFTRGLHDLLHRIVLGCRQRLHIRER